MDADLIAKYDRAVPRYTSYPTAPHFHAGIDHDVYAGWLGALAPELPLSLYLHVPYCRQMCWYCGCNTKIVARYEPVADFVTSLHAEIDLIADLLAARRQGRRSVSQIHWGGGTPNVMSPVDFGALMGRLRARFDLGKASELAIELDPRWVDQPWLDALRDAGINRVSLGVQDFDPTVQAAINRLQPVELVRSVMDGLRAAGISGINLDLIYGLPHQSLDTLQRTVELAAGLQPDRISLFGYAHVPWMKANQRQIDEGALPDAAARWQLQEAAADWLVARGYRMIGLDHFARPGDAMVAALDDGRLQRNFQGYTTDDADCLIGLGPSAIGSLPQGYVQNATGTEEWSRAIAAGRTAAKRGVALTPEDRLCRDIITRLMCDGRVDLEAVTKMHPAAEVDVAPALEKLRPLAADGLVTMAGGTINVTSLGRPLMRVAAACFDQYLRDSSSDAPQADQSALPVALQPRKTGRYSRVI
jgi:oxygen-independent coproporphyrinogen-3 oxidase